MQPGLRGAAARRLVMEAARAKARLPANPPSFPGPERARSRGPMGDRGLRRAEAGAASPPGFRGDRLGASLRECPDQRLRALREERARWAAPSLAEGCVAADEELVPIHVVQA